MWFLIAIGFPVLEVWLLFRVGAEIGLANTFFYLLACMVFGIGLVRSQSAYLTRTMTAGMAKGQLPSQQLMHSLALFVAGLLFMFPGYLSSVLGLFLVLPGTRHLAVAFMKRKVQTMIQRGAVRFGGMGSMGGFTWSSGPTPRPPMRDVSPLEIDSQTNHEVIDVTPTKKD